MRFITYLVSTSSHKRNLWTANSKAEKFRNSEDFRHNAVYCKRKYTGSRKKEQWKRTKRTGCTLTLNERIDQGSYFKTIPRCSSQPSLACPRTCEKSIPAYNGSLISRTKKQSNSPSTSTIKIYAQVAFNLPPSSSRNGSQAPGKIKGISKKSISDSSARKRRSKGRKF